MSFAIRDAQHGWVVCTRQGTDRDGNLLLLGPDGKRLKVAPSEALPIAAPERAAATANLLDLVEFNEANVFLALQERLSRSLVYTFLGTSLVSVNPNYYQDLYSEDVQAMYRGLPNWQTQRLPPHLYSIAQFAYSELLHSGGEQAQTILLTGRVGSGKTEASKYLLRFLVGVGGVSVPPEADEGPTLAQKLEWAHVILEAFGNAATGENYNSSRFGLLTQLFFGVNGRVAGGEFTPYLFERTRVTRINEGERNFHVFYQLVNGASAEEKKNLVLLAPNKYRYLRAGNVVSLPEIDDAGYFAALKEAFKGLKMQGSLAAVFRVVSAILHLGNVSFVHDEASGDVKIKSPKVLNVVAALLACDENTLAQVMCEAQPLPTLDDEEPPPATKPAEDVRDLIAQTIYSRLFDWLVKELNSQIVCEASDRFISLLDPFGFEDCAVNSLHQLSVNYASERLFSDLIETRNLEEQELYVEEGTNWERLDLDNGSSARCLEVYDMPDVGVWDVITEQAQDPNAVDVDIINSLCETFAGSAVLQRCEGRYEMVLQHRSGDVVYNVQGFLVQNMEAISDSLWHCFEHSTSVFVKNLFAASLRGEASSLLSVRAPSDVNFVLSLVMPTRLHFVHCIAPNTQGVADLVDGNVILMQIIASGMLGTGLLRGKGYLCNLPFDEVVQRYGMLATPKPRRRQNVSANECSRMLKSLLADLDNDKLFHVGPTRVFLSHAAFRVLEAKRSARLKEAAATIASITHRRRFFLRVSDLVAQKAPKRVAVAPKVTSPRRNLPALPSKESGTAAAASAVPAGGTVTLSRGSGVDAAVDLTRGAIGLVRMLYKEPIQRGEIVQKLKEIKNVEEEFRLLERENVGQDELYDAALDVVFTTLSVFCDHVREVCRSNENKPALLTQCKASHNELVMAIRSWKSEYTRFSSVAKSPRVSMQRSATVSNMSRSTSGAPPSSPRRAPPAQPGAAPTRAVPELSASRRGTQAVSPRLSSSPRLSGSPMSSPRSGLTTSSPAATNVHAANVTASPAGTRIVFHDSPKQKRKAQTREIMSKIVNGGGSVKETLDKLDSELGIKDLKKDSCILQFDLADGTRLRTKVSTKWTGVDAKTYILNKASSYMNGAVNNPADYLLRISGLPSTVSNEGVPLSRVGYVQACTYVFVVPVLEVIKASTWDFGKEVDLTSQISSELRLHTTISKLIGPSFKSFLEVEDDEFSMLRSAMTHARLRNAKEMASAREGRMFMLHEYVDGEPMPPVVPEKIMINLRLPIGQGMIAMEPSDTVEQVLEKACAKIRRTDPKRKDVPDQYLIKETGRQSFMLGNEPMLHYDTVRNMICAGLPVQLSLVEKASTLASYSEEEFSRTSFMDRILESWLEDQPVVQDESNCDFITRATLSELSRPWKLKLHGLQGVPSKYLQEHNGELELHFHFFLRLAVVQGDGQCVHIQFTKTSLAAANLRWDQWIFVCPVNQLARGARLSISVHALFTIDPPATIDEEICASSERMGWVNIPMFDQYGVLIGGSNTTGYQLWVGDEQAFDYTCQENIFSDTWLYVSFEDSKKSIVYPSPARSGFRLAASSSGVTSSRGVLAQQDQARGEQRAKLIACKDLLTPLSSDDKKLLWEHRNALTNIPEALPKVLRSVNWNDYLHAQDMYTLMREWCELKAVHVLQLVSGFFLDPFIREFAVERMANLTDAELLMYMPQLTQALKYEAYHFNALAEFLVRRALNNRHRLGHVFFWSLKAEMHLPKVSGRYGCLLESYLRGAGTHRRELEMQGQIVDQLVVIARALKDIKDHEQRLTYLRSQLGTLQMPARYQLPLDPRYEVSGLVIEKCKFMDSKKVPLWLVFKNAEEGAPNITVIFKEGDDLRQDILTIQMLKLMNNLWKQEGLDLGMNPYGCIACGDEMGMIEVVGNSMTTAGIAREFGGAKAVLQKDVMLKWLKENNEKPENFVQAQNNFMRSCAAYCVATYVLGIGDRHNDNIMCTRNGYFFHIDFGHFLGNFKSKMGIKRETAPFVLTQQYVEVMGGKKSANYREFVSLCCRIFNILRRNADLFITLFHLMLLTGIPELQREKDIEYLRTALHLHLSEAEASKKFEELIDKALGSKMTNVNHFVHNLAKS